MIPNAANPFHKPPTSPYTGEGTLGLPSSPPGRYRQRTGSCEPLGGQGVAGVAELVDALDLGSSDGLVLRLGNTRVDRPPVKPMGYRPPRR